MNINVKIEPNKEKDKKEINEGSRLNLLLKAVIIYLFSSYNYYEVERIVVRVAFEFDEVHKHGKF